MTDLELAATERSPKVSFRSREGSLLIQGCSIPENADAFYTPLLDLLEHYGKAPRRDTLVRVELTHFNSSSSKYLLDLFKILEELHLAGATKVDLEWAHAEDDMDMEEAGLDYKALLDLPLKLVKR